MATQKEIVSFWQLGIQIQVHFDPATTQRSDGGAGHRKCRNHYLCWIKFYFESRPQQQRVCRARWMMHHKYRDLHTYLQKAPGRNSLSVSLRRREIRASGSGHSDGAFSSLAFVEASRKDLASSMLRDLRWVRSTLALSSCVAS